MVTSNLLKYFITQSLNMNANRVFVIHNFIDGIVVVEINICGGVLALNLDMFYSTEDFKIYPQLIFSKISD